MGSQTSIPRDTARTEVMIGRVMWVTWVVYITILPTVICSNHNNHEISGGTNANKNEFPYIARLIIWNGRGYGICGASLLSEKYLATASHCFSKKKSASAINKDFDDNCKNQRNKCVAFIRDHDTRRLDTDEVMIDMRKIHLKPGRYIDFLIVELVRSVNLDKRANPIPVSQSAVKIGQKVITAGWGLVAHNKWHPILQTASLEVSSVRNGYVGTKVGYNNRGVPIDPCGGDSGGPLVIREANGDKLVGALIGNGYDCRDDTTNGDGLWTDVTYHYDWINSVIHSGRSCDLDIAVNTVCADCGRRFVALTNTAKECRDICYNKQSCKHWIWHTHQAGGWSKQCMLIDRLGGIYKIKDTNTLTGECTGPLPAPNGN